MFDESLSQQTTSVCAVVVTLNPDEEFSSRLEATIRQVDYVVIVDNGSSSDARRNLENAGTHDKVSIIVNDCNRGIATALNQGINYAREHGFDWALTLDQDSTPSEKMIAEQLAVYERCEEKKRIGIIAANPIDAVLRKSAYERKCSEQLWIDPPVVITSGALTSVKAFIEVGPMREDFFIDGVDQEYCLRLRRRGYRVRLACRAELWHRLGQPRKQKLLWRNVVPTNHSSVRRYYTARNRIFIAKQHFKDEPGWITHQLIALVKSTVLIVLCEGDKIAKLRSTALGIWHGLIGRTGQLSTDVGSTHTLRDPG